MEETLKNIISSITSVDEEKLKPETSIKDLEIDSIDAIQVILTIEDEFNINLEDYEIEENHTIADLITIIKEKTKQ